jgi:hypothetical protein
LLDQAEFEANKAVFEKTLEQLLPLLMMKSKRKHHSIQPGVPRKTPTINWYSYKWHFAVDRESQYILTALFSSAHVNNGKMSIPHRIPVVLTGEVFFLKKGIHHWGEPKTVRGTSWYWIHFYDNTNR